MGGFNLLRPAGIEALTRAWPGRSATRYGVQVVALRPNFTPETVPGFTDDRHKNVSDTQLADATPAARVRGYCGFTGLERPGL